MIPTSLSLNARWALVLAPLLLLGCGDSEGKTPSSCPDLGLYVPGEGGPDPDALAEALERNCVSPAVPPAATTNSAAPSLEGAAGAEPGS